MSEEQPGGPRPNGHDAGRPARGAVTAFAGDPEARERMRRMIEGTPRSLRAIADDLALPRGSLTRYVTKQGWTRPDAAPKPPMRADGTRIRHGPKPKRLAVGLAEAGAVSDRLVRAVDRQLFLIEARLKKPGAEIEEKDARILGNLAKTLATLMALERDGGAKTKETEPADRGDFRAELVRRIAAWAEQGSEPAGAGGQSDGGTG